MTSADLVARGMPWGGLQQKLTGKKLSPSQFFDEATLDKTNPALEMQVGATSFAVANPERLSAATYMTFPQLAVA